MIKEPLDDWCDVTGSNDDLTGYLNFIISDEFISIPNYNIFCRLITDIVTSKKPWETGDLKDVSNLSAYIPYCDYILTDLKQYNRVKRLNLDQEYSTNVYCMKNIDRLIEVIKTL